LDIFLPDFDGVDVFRRIKDVPTRTRIIMMTAGMVIMAMQESIAEHAYMFLTKPFDLFQVKMLTKSLLEERCN